MIDLLLNVVFASAFMLSIKWIQVRELEDVVTVGAISYIVSALLILPQYLQNDVVGPSINAMLSGGMMGFCYFVAFFLVIVSIRWVGVSTSTVISMLSILLPIACGILIWSERPNTYQNVGIVLAMLALLLIGGARKETQTEGRSWFRIGVLIVFFLLAGSSRLAQEAFKHMSQPDQRPTFLLTAFVVAAIPSIILLLMRGRRISRREIAFGLMLGTANILQTHFLLRSLETYDGFVVFPVTSAGAIVLTTVVATRMLGEQLNRRTYSGIAIAVVALVLLNWLGGDF